MCGGDAIIALRVYLVLPSVYSMLCSNASGLEIALAGRISAGFFLVGKPQNQTSVRRPAGEQILLFSLRIRLRKADFRPGSTIA